MSKYPELFMTDSLEKLTNDEEFTTFFTSLLQKLTQLKTLNKPFTLILDDTTILENTFISQKAIAFSLTKLSEIMSGNDQVIVSYLEISSSLSTYLTKMSDSYVRIHPLLTGATREIHGQIHVTTRETKMHYHYTVQDASIHLFAPGFAKSVL